MTTNIIYMYFEGIKSMFRSMESEYLNQIRNVIVQSPKPIPIINEDADMEAEETTAMCETLVYDGYAYDVCFDQVKVEWDEDNDRCRLYFHVSDGGEYCNDNKWISEWEIGRDAVMDLLDHIVWPED